MELRGGRVRLELPGSLGWIPGPARAGILHTALSRDEEDDSGLLVGAPAGRRMRALDTSCVDSALLLLPSATMDGCEEGEIAVGSLELPDEKAQSKHSNLIKETKACSTYCSQSALTESKRNKQEPASCRSRGCSGHI